MGNVPDPRRPIGTDEVTGSITNQTTGDLQDFFNFSGLQPFANFTLDAVETSGFGPPPQLFVNGASVGILDTSLTSVVPASGTLIVSLSGFSGEGDHGYRVTLDAPLAAQVSAPSALSLTGLGAALAGALTWRRRKRAR